MPRKRMVPLRKRIATSTATAPIVIETVDSDGTGKRVIHFPDERGKYVASGFTFPNHDGGTIRSSGDERSEKAGVRFQIRALVKGFTGGARAVEKWVSYWAKRGLRLTPCYRKAAPGQEPAPLTEPYREWKSLYVWTVSGGTEADIAAFAASQEVVLVRQGILADGYGASLEYRRLQDQRKHDKKGKALDYNHGSGFGNVNGRRLSAP